MRRVQGGCPTLPRYPPSATSLNEPSCRSGVGDASMHRALRSRQSCALPRRSATNNKTGREGGCGRDGQRHALPVREDNTTCCGQNRGLSADKRTTHPSSPKSQHAARSIERSVARAGRGGGLSFTFDGEDLTGQDIKLTTVPCFPRFHSHFSEYTSPDIMR